MASGDVRDGERGGMECAGNRMAENSGKHGSGTIQGAARVIDAYTVEIVRYGVGTRRVTGEIILIATGSSPLAPVGFDIDGIALHPQRGIGLRNMMERMEAIGGVLAITSSPAGSVVLARVGLST